MGNLSYFHRYKNLILKRTKRLSSDNKKPQISIVASKLNDAIFYLLDSEISLQTGNTEEFYNEITTFMLENFNKMEFVKICHLFYKTLFVVLIQHAAYNDKKQLLYTDNSCCLDILNFGNYYPKFSRKNWEIN